MNEVVPLCVDRGPPASRGDNTGDPVPARAFFDRTDWSSLALTTLLALAAYLWTLAPDVTLQFSGVLSVGAMYGGVAHPPGYPIWTLYAWAFANLLPFSNSAWRVGVSSAVAAALTCGVIALMVSRGGELVRADVLESSQLKPNEWRRLRLVSGCVAGLGLAFDGGFWRRAVIVDTWPLSILLFALTLCLLMRWSCSPERRGALYGAVLAFSLTTTNSQLLFCAALGLECVILIVEPRFRRDICFANSIAFFAALIPFWFLRKAQFHHRRWMLGLLAVWLSLTLLLIVVMNPPSDRPSVELFGSNFTASHLLMAVWAGYGLVLLGSWRHRDASEHFKERLAQRRREHRGRD